MYLLLITYLSPVTHRFKTCFWGEDESEANSCTDIMNVLARYHQNVSCIAITSFGKNLFYNMVRVCKPII
jgi:hypothetical protein